MYFMYEHIGAYFMYESRIFYISHMKICVYFSMKIEFSIFHIENIGAYFTCENGISIFHI